MRKKAAPEDLWDRALQTLNAARLLLDTTPDKSASCSYYAAMYGLQAIFLLEGKQLESHAAVWTAFHKERIKSRKWPEELGELFGRVREDRETGDYGGSAHVEPEEARKSLKAALAILEAIHKENPGKFPMADGKSREIERRGIPVLIENRMAIVSL